MMRYVSQFDASTISIRSINNKGLYNIVCKGCGNIHNLEKCIYCGISRQESKNKIYKGEKII